MNDAREALRRMGEEEMMVSPRMVMESYEPKWEKRNHVWHKRRRRRWLRASVVCLWCAAMAIGYAAEVRWLILGCAYIALLWLICAFFNRA